MIPKAGLSGTFYKIRNDDVLFDKATRNLANQLNYFQKIGAGVHVYLELNGTVFSGNASASAENKTSESFGKIYSWPDTAVDARYLSGAVDIESVTENIQKNTKFNAFKSYINEGSDQVLDVVPYARENAIFDGDERTIHSVNIGIKVCAQSMSDFEDGLQAFKAWEQSNIRNNFHHEPLLSDENFSLFK